MAKDRGVKIVISTDSHTAANLKYMKYGVTTARRGWLTKDDVVNTLPVEQFLAALRPKPGGATPTKTASAPTTVAAPKKKPTKAKSA